MEQLISSTATTATWASSTLLSIENTTDSVPGVGVDGDIDLSIYLRFASNRRVHETAFFSLIFSYILLIVIGSAGNLLVVYAVV